MGAVILPFQLNPEEYLCFFAVMMRFLAFTIALPFLGHSHIPVAVKLLLGLVLTTVLYPVLTANDLIKPSDAVIWGGTAFGIAKVVFCELATGLILSFSARLVFDAIQMGGEIIGNLMGYGAASQYDPYQESQSQIIAQLFTTVSMLMFLALEGHHVILQVLLRSYEIIGVAKINFGTTFSDRLIGLSGETFKLGLQIAAPMAIVTFSINIVYGVLARAMPQLNILVLSFSVSAIVGVFVLILSFPETMNVVSNAFEQMDDNLVMMMRQMAS